MRSAKPSTTAVLPTPGLAGQDRVVLPPAHQHVDDLADLRVAADHRVDLAGPRRARSGRSRTSPAPSRRPGARRGAASAAGSRRGAAPPSIEPASTSSSRAPIASASILSNSRADLAEQAVEHRHLERGEQDVGRAHRLVAELQRAVAPALLDGVEDVVGEVLDRGGAVGQPVDGRGSCRRRGARRRRRPRRGSAARRRGRSAPAARRSARARRRGCRAAWRCRPPP